METVEFFIQRKQVGFTCDIETCKRLLTDDDFTLDYIVRATQANQLAEFGISSEDLSSLEVIRASEQPHAPNALQAISGDALCSYVETFEESGPKRVWVSHKKSPHDVEATEMLLQLRGRDDFKKKFSDKKHHKIGLWTMIAKEIINAGFDLGVEKEAAEKCRQKFANLQKLYISFRDNVNKTGAEFKEKPQFYDLLHNILGEKDKVTPQYLVDSLLDEPGHSDLEIPGPSGISSHSGRSNSTRNEPAQELPLEEEEGNATFFEVKKTIKPPNTKQSIITVIKECHGAQIQQLKDISFIIKENMQKQTTFLEEQTKQRGTLIDILKKLCDDGEKSDKKIKRKRKCSSDSE